MNETSPPITYLEINCIFVFLVLAVRSMQDYTLNLIMLNIILTNKIVSRMMVCLHIIREFQNLFHTNFFSGTIILKVIQHLHALNQEVTKLTFFTNKHKLYFTQLVM